MIPSYKIWISVGMNDVNYEVLERPGVRIFIHVSNASRCVHNLIKRYRAFRVLGENVFEKI